MRRQESGFTLIELVIVLVIMGILAAVAVPQFYDASNDAKTAAVAGGKSAVASAIAVEVGRNANHTTPKGSSIATQLGAGSTCSGTFIQIPGSGTTGVKVGFVGAADCTTASVTGLGAAATHKYTTAL